MSAVNSSHHWFGFLLLFRKFWAEMSPQSKHTLVRHQALGFGGYVLWAGVILLEFQRRTFDLILVGTIELPSL